MKFPHYHLNKEDTVDRNTNFRKLRFIQIGFNKTGTTQMQDYIYPKILGLKTLQGAYYKKINKAVDYICFERESNFSINTAKNLFHEGFIDAIGEIPQAFLHESLTFRYFINFDQKQVIKRLSSIFPESIFVLGSRERCSWLTSHWGQYIRSGGTMSLNNFTELMINRQNSDLHMCFFGQISDYCYRYFGRERFIFYDVKQLKYTKDIIKLFGERTNHNFQPEAISSKTNAKEYSATYQVMRLLNLIVRHDCGATPYSRSETDKPSDHQFNKIVHRIKYKYKYAKVPVARMIGNILQFLKIELNAEISKEHKIEIQKKFSQDEVIRLKNLTINT